MYAKIFSQIYDSSIAEDYQVRHVFMDLLVLADKAGVVDMTVEAVARRTNIPMRILRKALLTLLAPDPDSRSKEEEGRRIVPLDDRGWGWRIVNFEGYHKIRDENARREYMKDYMRKRREKKAKEQKPLTPVNTCKPELSNVDVDVDVDLKTITGKDASKGKDNGYSEAFLRFWEAYPRYKTRRRCKQKCYGYWKRDKLDGKVDEVIAVLEAMKIIWMEDDNQYVPLTTTWFNEKRWADDLDDIKAASTTQQIGYRYPTDEQIAAEGTQ